MIGHDDVVKNRNHGIMCMDGSEQFALYHLPNGRKLRVGGIEGTIGGIRIAHNST